MNAAIIFDTVSYKIGTTVLLEKISLSINKGEITGFLGQNGAGKSTLLSLINGLRSQSSGTITLLGQNLPSKDTSIRARIGVVLQETALYEELTTYENLRFSASLYNVANPHARIEEVLALLQLTDRSNQVVKTLSGGLRRRIAIARALLHEPELLLIDEPTLGVDVQARHAIWQHLRLLKSKGTTVVVATNYLDEAQALCSSVAVLRQGKLVAYETPDALVGRAGYCLDIDCNEKDYKTITSLMQKESDVMHIDPIPGGVSLFVKSDAAQKRIISMIIKTVPIEGFHVRAPDLAEVFTTLDKTL